jgi:stage II sporulation protein D
MMIFSIPSLSKAAEPTIYSIPVYVSIQKATNLTMNLNSDYQLTNNQTGISVIIPASTTVSVKNSGSGVAVSYPGVTQISSTGFQVQELINPVSTSIVTLSNGKSYRGSFNLKVNGSYVEVINFLDLEDYVKGVAPNEMPASWAKEALKAQAITARTYAVKAGAKVLSSTPSDQVYNGYSSEDPRTNAAVLDTEGLLVKFAGKPISTLFYSTSGGQTANYGDVWNSSYASSYPYLVSVSDPFEVSPYYSNWSVTVPSSAILKSFGFNGSTTKLLDMSLNATGANGEVSGVTVKTSSGDKTIQGSESVIRNLFPIGSSSNYNILYSNWFTMTPTIAQEASTGLSLSVQTSAGTESVTDLKGQTVQTTNGTVTLDGSNVSIQTVNGIVSTSGSAANEITSVTLNGKGFGHRLGMSQYGAKGYAEHGWTAIQILQHYYVGTTISK